MWPCTKTSTFASGTAAATAAMSSIESSRVSTTVRAPSVSAAKRAPSASETDICVDACSGSDGATAWSREASPTSCTMRPSTPAASAARAMRSACAISASYTRTLTHMYPSSPCAWSFAISAGSSSSPKLVARARRVERAAQPK